METTGAWVNETRKQCSRWAEVFTTSAGESKTVDQFVRDRFADWQLAVEEWFGREARKRLRTVKDENLRNQIVRGFVTVMDLTRTLEQQQNEPEPAADTMLALGAALQRLAAALNRLRSTLPPTEQEEAPAAEPVGDKDEPTDEVKTPDGAGEGSAAGKTGKPASARAGSRPGTDDEEADLPEFPTPTPVRIPERRRGLSVPPDRAPRPRRAKRGPFDSSDAKITARQVPSDFVMEVSDPGIAIRQKDEPSQDSERSEDSAIVVIPVDLTKDEDWDEPVVPLTRKKDKEPSHGRHPSADSRPEGGRAEPPVEGQPEPSPRTEAGATAAEQTEILGRLGVVLGWGLPRNVKTLSRGLGRLDRHFGGPGEEGLTSAERGQLSSALAGLASGMRAAVEEACTQAGVDSLDFVVSEATAFDSVDELPAAQVARDLISDEADGSGLMDHLTNLRGPALGFRFEVHARPGPRGASFIPDNRLEFGLAAEPERILITALHLIESSRDRRLGRAASSGLPGAGIFFQLQLPPKTRPVYRKAAERFALSEVGRFVLHLRRHSR